MPYFDQLFERLPNGQYREREKPIAPDPNGVRFCRSEKTGKICVMFSISWSEAVRTGMVTFKPRDTQASASPMLSKFQTWEQGKWPAEFGLVGGNWGELPKTADENYRFLYGAGWQATFNESQKVEPLGARVVLL